MQLPETKTVNHNNYYRQGCRSSLNFTVPLSFFFPSSFRKGLESNVLRFVARLDTTRPIDTDRR